MSERIDNHRFEFYGEGLPDVDLAELHGRLIVIEGSDGIGRSTQVAMLKPWLESNGHAVLDTGMTRSALAGKGIKQAKAGITLGPDRQDLERSPDAAIDVGDGLECGVALDVPHELDAQRRKL